MEPCRSSTRSKRCLQTENNVDEVEECTNVTKVESKTPLLGERSDGMITSPSFPETPPPKCMKYSAASTTQNRSDDTTETSKVDVQSERKTEEMVGGAAAKAAASPLNELRQQMQQLQVAAKCKHGHTPLPKGDICVKLGKEFHLEFEASNGNLFGAYQMTKEKYAEVWKDEAKMNVMVNYLLWSATEWLLNGVRDEASTSACWAHFFEQTIAVLLRESQNNWDLAKLHELLVGVDEHTFVSFLRKRIPCSCLDGKYNEAKSVKKIGMCSNPKCVESNITAELSTMLYCTKCHEANYCSRECQKVDWPFHKQWCQRFANSKASFDIWMNCHHITFTKCADG